ncbi:MAG: PilT/PilU family type 4a pilus ATPase [Defluviitaleaceae bacterium]|nr:PilT/PilU family type 4a pilus ATPase [Defluviitaleaceae bacterium]
MQVESFLKESVDRRASDIYIIEKKPITFKVNGNMEYFDSNTLGGAQTEEILRALYSLAGGRDFNKLASGDDDFAVSVAGVGRFRVNAYRQRLSYASVIRTIPMGLPDPAKLNIPEVIVNLANYTRGIVLFTGTTGSGKSTSLACLIDKINSTRQDHIITIEDPVEFQHEHKTGIVSQRELEADTHGYVSALRAAMRQVPDVILVGEMRDYETISAAITAAETGHLVFSTLHTIGAAATIDRIIDVFPPNQQNQIRTQLSVTLQAVVSQQLIPTLEGKRLPAYEIMIVNSAIRNLIRENKTFQIENIIQTSASLGMKTMDMSIYDLYRQKNISKENALLFSVNQQTMASRISGQAR